MRRLRVGPCLAVVFGITGCLGDGDDHVEPQTCQVLKSDLPRELNPSTDPSELEALVRGNNEFACSLYQEVRGEDGNLVFSPYSVSTAYAMAYAGARGSTETQMAEALCFALAQDRLHPAFNRLDLDIAGRTGDGEEAPRLKIVNSLWGQRDFSFLPSFLDVLAVNYGAGIRLVDFAANAEAARLAINDWAADETEGLIRDLVPPEAVSPLTVFVLANTVYFKAKWAYVFDPEDTTAQPFTLLDDSQVDVPMMRQEVFAGYTSGAGYQAAEVYYTGGDYYWDGSDISMLVLLPDEGRFEEFEGALTAAKLDEMTASLSSGLLWLSMPRFSCESPLDLKDILPRMGMTDAFLPGTADFSGVSAGGGVWIEASGHKARISVNEYGTEAAAGTYVGGWIGIPGEFVMNRPFIFLVRDRQTGTILFLGRVLDPRG